MTTLPKLYDLKLENGDIRLDPDQLRAVQALEKLRQALVTRKAPRSWLKILGKNAGKGAPRGYYFYGAVGRGKSMLMDLFFNAAPVEKKRRVHFYAFMLEVHDFLHAQRTSGRARKRIDGDLIACADSIAETAQLLCFDEFQVRDVADAMILGRLFTALFERGVVVVMTSNIAPDELYADGLQRDRFLPFIDLLKKKLHVFHFSGDKDYRLNRLREGEVYFWPHDAVAEAELEKIFRMLSDGEAGAPLDIAVKGRVIHAPRAVREVAEFTFAELCDQPKSALDYLELAKRFRVFIVRDVPVLTDSRRNAILRFVTLVDTLYDHQARLVVSAAVPPEQLYRGEEYAHVFERTVSRLMEMQSREYREK
jgi:cell division protein ZapE